MSLPSPSSDCVPVNNGTRSRAHVWELTQLPETRIVLGLLLHRHSVTSQDQSSEVLLHMHKDFYQRFEEWKEAVVPGRNYVSTWLPPTTNYPSSTPVTPGGRPSKLFKAGFHPGQVARASRDHIDGQTTVHTQKHLKTISSSQSRLENLERTQQEGAKPCHPTANYH